MIEAEGQLPGLRLDKYRSSPLMPSHLFYTAAHSLGYNFLMHQIVGENEDQTIEVLVPTQEELRDLFMLKEQFLKTLEGLTIGNIYKGEYYPLMMVGSEYFFGSSGKHLKYIEPTSRKAAFMRAYEIDRDLGLDSINGLPREDYIKTQAFYRYIGLQAQGLGSLNDQDILQMTFEGIANVANLTRRFPNDL